MREKIVTHLQERFGIPMSVFDDFEFYGGNKGRVYLGPKNPIINPEPVSMGLLVIRVDNSIKPTTNLLQLFGRYANKNIVILTKNHTLEYTNGSDIRPTAEETNNSTNGYVVVSYEDSVIGCGMLKEGLLTNLIPKAKRLKLKFI